MTVQDSFSTKEVAQLADVPLRTLQYWAAHGFITPSERGAGGHGGGHGWSFRDVLAVRVATEIRETMETDLRVLRTVQERVREHTGEDLAGVMLVISRGDVFCVDGGELVSLLKQPGQIAISQIVNLENVEEEIREKAAELVA